MTDEHGAPDGGHGKPLGDPEGETAIGRENWGKSTAVARLLSPDETRGSAAALVADQREASRIHNKGALGQPVSGGGLLLNPMEVLYLMESGNLGVVRETAGETERQDMKDVLKWAMSSIPSFEIKYAVFRDMRNRGYYIKYEEDSYYSEIYKT
ncbi:MAG: hypothetical protein J7L61_03655, partial [Thermoplasmata archaeon]|nr:hypothetical protein [Thermoplasmata archaeon]